MRITPRREWGATSKSLPSRSMTLPAREVWIHHSVTPVTSDPHLDMRTIEKVGISRFGQFSYSFCVHPDGTVLEGAGLKVGAHTAGRNSTSFGICWIGNYEERLPKVQQIDATRWLIAHLIDHMYLVAGTYPTGGHRDLKATACPGARLYAILDDLRRPWREPAIAPAVPGPVVTHFPGEDTMMRYDVHIALDDKGNGWAAVDVPAQKVVSMVANGPHPPADGYWNLPALGRQDRDGRTTVTATEGRPGDVVLVTLWALD